MITPLLKPIPQICPRLTELPRIQLRRRQLLPQLIQLFLDRLELVTDRNRYVLDVDVTGGYRREDLMEALFDLYEDYVADCHAVELVGF